jgi:hypothetical protein
MAAADSPFQRLIQAYSGRPSNIRVRVPRSPSPPRARLARPGDEALYAQAMTLTQQQVEELSPERRAQILQLRQALMAGEPSLAPSATNIAVPLFTAPYLPASLLTRARAIAVRNRLYYKEDEFQGFLATTRVLTKLGFANLDITIVSNNLN